jgi:hypothetical protein
VTLRLELLQVARLAPNVLGEAAGRVAEFAREQFNGDGGVRDRAGKSDLYYTVFGLECLVALRQEVPVERVRPWLEGFGDGGGLDLVHLACLARCWASLPRGDLARDVSFRIADRIRACPASGPYPSFLAFAALEDLGESPGPPARLEEEAARTTPTTAARVTCLHHCGSPVPPELGSWLLRRAHPKGGFTASEGAPLPDLLSTATALHALAAIKVDLRHLKEATLDFIDTLWTGRAFCGSWADDVADVEYTWYALLAMGHLSLA